MKRINLRKFNIRLLTRLSAQEKRITIATLFTITRLVLTPFIVGAMVSGYWGIAFLLFVFAALTDVIDGALAQLCEQKTFLGACLDPIADKILLLSCFATLAFIDTPLFTIPRWFVLFILGKEVLQVGGAIVLYNMKGHLDVRPTLLGKLTMVAQVCFIIWLFACYFFHWMPIKTYYTMLSVLLILVFAALAQYVVIGMKYFLINK
ncbi:MAG TPA: CDP-alcohol phosphatidyltransferase family protein [Candidatus Dependentiae bacterium]|nr:CDP-alcohol phosphatidyltransferase family protein [Candidatus Dependentiae bacterium]